MQIKQKFEVGIKIGDFCQTEYGGRWYRVLAVSIDTATLADDESSLMFLVQKDEILTTGRKEKNA